MLFGHKPPDLARGTTSFERRLHQPLGAQMSRRDWDVPARLRRDCQCLKPRPDYSSCAGTRDRPAQSWMSATIAASRPPAPQAACTIFIAGLRRAAAPPHPRLPLAFRRGCSSSPTPISIVTRRPPREAVADGADLSTVRKLAADPSIAGFTTNPTLMRKAGIVDYEEFAHEFIDIVPDRPISFEVFADEPGEMERQALRIADWGDNVYVKIPITTTDGATTSRWCGRLADQGVQQNVTRF